jgi:hydroxyquinol 1,2-dioxygenase
MLTVAINAPDDPAATESTVFGPFFVENSPEIPIGGDMAEGVKGEPCWVEGRVTDTHGEPLRGARIEVWEADDDGFYDVQQGETLSGRAHLFAGDDGRYGFWSVKPAPYPIPYDGPVGDLLKAAQRSPYRPAHIHFMVSHEGHETLVTHVFLEGSEHLDDDAVFGVKESLIAPATQQDPGEGPGGRTLDAPWWRMTFDLRLA